MDKIKFSFPERIKIAFDTTKQFIQDLPHNVAMWWILNARAVRDEFTIKPLNERGASLDIDSTPQEIKEAIMTIQPVEVEIVVPTEEDSLFHSAAQVWADNYNEARPGGMVIIFSNALTEINLTGADYYKCSDGFESNTSTNHVFEDNIEADNKHSRWVIFYSQAPTYAFPADFAGKIIECGFFNCDTSMIPRQLARGAERLHFDCETVVIAASLCYACISLTELYFTDNCKSITVGDSAFFQCIALSYIRFPNYVERLAFGGNSFFRNDTLKGVMFPKAGKEVYTGSAFRTCQNNVVVKFPETVESLIIGGFEDNISLIAVQFPFTAKVITITTNAFMNSIIEKLTFFNYEKLVFNTNSFRLCAKLMVIDIPVVDILQLNDAAFGAWTGGDKAVYMANPRQSYSAIWTAFNNTSIKTIVLGEGWNYSIRLDVATNLSIDSVVESLQNAILRTGTNVITITVPAAIKTLLISDYPDLIAECNSKNINIA